MRKIYSIITKTVLVLAAFTVCNLSNSLLTHAAQKLPAEENSLAMSISFIHQIDDFYEIQVEYPQFNGADNTFNQKVSGLITDKIETFKKEVRDNYEARRTTALPENPLPEIPDLPMPFICSWKPTQLNNHYLSFVIHLYYFTGGAHGVSEVYAFNYDLKKRKEITILDFLNTSPINLEKLADLSQQEVISQLESQDLLFNEFLEQMIEEGTEPNIENYKNFNFNHNSLTIYFQQYQVAPGYIGPITLEFYKDTLNANSLHSDYLP